MERYVVYFRVSTARQGHSGLGMEAQAAAVQAFLAGRSAKAIGTFTEIESGRKNNRPKLREAMEMARAYGAVLLVAKLDRLARNATFLLSLKDAGVEFIAADMPEANRLTVGILALVAEQEAVAISDRTKAALAARKARGLPLGNTTTLVIGNAYTAARASSVASEEARKAAQRVLPIVSRLKHAGFSLHAIARQLNADAVPSARGGKWTPTSVRNILRQEHNTNLAHPICVPSHNAHSFAK
jgi:DNA invertase Pin-like site-specific DNA recombinase